MHIGIPREVMDGEGRVGAIPDVVAALTQAGHAVTVETGAGLQAGYSDEAYEKAGATLASSPAQVYAASFIVKVKEPQEEEWGHLRRGQILFCYLHLAANPRLERFLKEEGVLAVAYETVTDDAGCLPLLAPMSQMAGRIAVQEGAHLLGTPQGGKGVLIGMGRVVVLGAGVVGTNAAEIAVGMDASVSVFDHKKPALDHLQQTLPTVETLESELIAVHLETADLVIGALLIPGKSTPKLVTKKMVEGMENGSVFVDVAIDQGGCSETSKPTSHSKPTYVESGVVHYCVTNIPGAFPKSASVALSQASLPYILEIAGRAS